MNEVDDPEVPDPKTLIVDEASKQMAKSKFLRINLDRG
jgi:hypothetical protein